MLPNKAREEILDYLENRSEQEPGSYSGQGLPPKSASEWPEPEPLEGALPPVQPLPLECLPASFRGLIEDVGERMQVPLDYPAAIAIVSLAGCVNRRAIIQPKKEDYSWEVVPNLWGAVIGPPGFLKSPVLRAVTCPLSHIEDMWRLEYEGDLANYKNAKEQAELSRQAWREDYKKAIKNNKPLPIEPDNTLAPPPQKRLLVMDATCEKLHEILSENPAGVLVVRDELIGWLGELDKPGREGSAASTLRHGTGIRDSLLIALVAAQFTFLPYASA